MGKIKSPLIHHINLLFLLLYATTLLAQQRIAINGTIRDFDDNPIDGAIITSLEKNASDTSNATGSFDIPTTPIIHNADAIKQAGRFEIRHNSVYIKLDSRGNIQIDLYSIGGRKIQSVFHGTLEKGTFRFPLTPQNISAQVYIVSVKSGTSLFVKKSIYLKNSGTAYNNQPQATHKQENETENRTYQSDVFDTLVVTHDDYINKRVWLYNYSDPVEVVLWDNEMRLTNEITSWTDKPEHFATFDTAQLYDLIDGGAPIYNDQGLVDGIYQFLENNDGKSCAISFYNFGTPDNSLAMFTVQKSLISSEIVIPGYDNSVAIGDEAIGGAVIFARFNQFDLELTFGGYTDVELLKNDAKLFLDVYKSKIGTIE